MLELFLFILVVIFYLTFGVNAMLKRWFEE